MRKAYIWVIPCQMNKFFLKLHQMFHIFMKFGTLVDLTEIIRMQKKVFKNFHYF